MWKIAVFTFLCLFGGLASYPHSDGDYSEEDCYDPSDCDGCEYVRVNGTCHKMATLSQNECEYDEQCATIGDICNNGECIHKKGIGESCTSDKECEDSNMLECFNGICECSIAAVQHGSTCLSKVLFLGAPCTEDVQCESLQAVCENGTCQAKGNPVILCNDENIEMVDGECRCRDGFVESDDGKSCLKEADKIGDECSISSQCTPVNGTCLGGVCTVVILASAAAPTVEAAPVLLGGECATDDDCKSVSNAVCRESACSCSESHITSPDEAKCLPLAIKSGDDCEIDKQCSKLPNSSCIGGKCNAIMAAGIKTSRNKTSSPFVTSGRVILTAIIMLGSRAIFS